MGDNLTRYCAIRDRLMQRQRATLNGHQRRNLDTLAQLVSGIVGSRKCQLPAVASKVPCQKDTCRDSRIKRFERFIRNKNVDTDTFYVPHLAPLLSSLPAGPLVLVMDSSVAGRECVVLMVSVLYQKRALPLCWQVVKGKKGHIADAIHVQLLQEAARLLPGERQILFLGDGEFNGLGLLGTLTALNWHYVCRINKNTLLRETDEKDTYSLRWLNTQPGDLIEVPDVLYTNEGFGPVQIVATWDQQHDAPLFLVHNFELPEEALHWYTQRFQIETFFSDQKSRGFDLHRSHVSACKRLKRLLIASCLAYLWMVCLGVLVKQQGKIGRIHRTKRCDLSLFQIGLHWLEHALNENLPIRVPLKIPKPLRRNECVR